MTRHASYRPELLVDGRWSPNGLRFKFRYEAEAWAELYFLHSGWTLPTGHHAVESDLPPNAELEVVEPGEGDPKLGGRHKVVMLD